MDNKKMGKYISIFGKVIAAGGAMLSIVHIIPSNGWLLWMLVICGGSLIFLGKKLDES